jgi:hypothetical protein
MRENRPRHVSVVAGDGVRRGRLLPVTSGISQTDVGQFSFRESA